MSGDDKSPVHQTCQQCGQAFPSDLLQNPSVPDRHAVMSLLINTEPDEPLPAEATDLLDRKLFCPRCVRRVNRHRIAVIITMCIVLPGVIWMILQLVLHKPTASGRGPEEVRTDPSVPKQE